MTVSYEGREFRKLGDDDGTVIRYHQDGDLVWTNFTGREIRCGAVTGLCGQDGALRLAYTMVLATGAVISGHTVNIPQRKADGRLVLREEWERYGEHAATGTSYLEEVGRTPESAPQQTGVRE